MTIEEFMRDIAPKMRPGWVAMDADGLWFWYSKNPTRLAHNFNIKDGEIYKMLIFDIAPVDNWETSLRKVGKKLLRRRVKAACSKGFMDAAIGGWCEIQK